MERIEKPLPVAPSPLQTPESLTPYQEIMRFLGQQGTDITESLDGGIKITEHTPDGDIVSIIGEVDEDLPEKLPDTIPFSSLSDGAQKLYHQFEKQGKVPKLHPPKASKGI